MIKSAFVREMTSQDHGELMSLFAYFRRTGAQFTEKQQEVIKHPLNLSDRQGISHSLTADFAFKCDTCEEIGLQPWYKLIINTIGGSPFYRSYTHLQDVIKGHDGSNLLKIIENVPLPADIMDSGLHYSEREGYVCDHCMAFSVSGSIVRK